MSGQRKIPAPAINPESQRFWDACSNGTLLIGRDNTSGEHFYYPRSISPFSGSDDVDWVEASGEGTIYSYSVMRRADPVYVIAYVTLSEGPAIMTNIVDCDFERIRIGNAVRLVFKDSDGGPPVPCFTLAEPGPIP